MVKVTVQVDGSCQSKTTANGSSNNEPNKPIRRTRLRRAFTGYQRYLDVSKMHLRDRVAAYGNPVDYIIPVQIREGPREGTGLFEVLHYIGNQFYENLLTPVVTSGTLPGYLVTRGLMTSPVQGFFDGDSYQRELMLHNGGSEFTEPLRNGLETLMESYGEHASPQLLAAYHFMQEGVFEMPEELGEKGLMYRIGANLGMTFARKVMKNYVVGCNMRPAQQRQELGDRVLLLNTV